MNIAPVKATGGGGPEVETRGSQDGGELLQVREAGPWGCGQRRGCQSLCPSLSDGDGDISFPPERKSSSLPPTRNRNRGSWERGAKAPAALSSARNESSVLPPRPTRRQRPRALLLLPSPLRKESAPRDDIPDTPGISPLLPLT